MKHVTGIILLCSLLLTSCQKEEEPMVLPPPGDELAMTATMGTSYHNQVYVSLSKNKMHSADYRNFDLAFEASPSGRKIYLNNAKYMFLTHTGNTSLTAADSVGASWVTDAEHLHADSTAVGSWWNLMSASTNGGDGEVMIIDRGRIDHTGSDRFRKIQVIAADDNHYRVRFSRLDNTGLNELTIPKDPAYSLMYFSFDNNGQVVQQAPPKDDWEFVFTKYTHEYFDEPLTSPYRYYPVTGCLSNIWNSIAGAVAKKDSTPGYVDFSKFTAAHAMQMSFSNRADIIGFEWKYYDFNASQFIIHPDLYYVLSDKNGYYYKIRMIDFYDQQGNKGTVNFQYQRL